MMNPMPYRKTPIVKDEIYHVFNRSIARQPIFRTNKDYQRILQLINYYRFEKPSLRYSHFNRLPDKQKAQFFDALVQSSPMLAIMAYCIMPNHIHFLLKGLKPNAISAFMRNIQHSYSKYYNVKNNRVGSLFQDMFKAVRIETDEQLIHVSRYIHLNPVSSAIIEIGSLARYPWTSFPDYISGSSNGIVDTSIVLSYFKLREIYKQFVFDNADYQRELDKVKHLLIE